MIIPKELRHHSPHDPEGKKNLRGRYKTKLAKSLNTNDFAMAQVEKLQSVYKWKKLFQMYRLGEVVAETVDEMAERWGQKLGRENFNDAALYQVALETLTIHDVQSLTEQNKAETASEIPDNAIDAFGKSTKNLCTLTDHLEDFISSYGYSPAICVDARSLIKNRFVKHFPHFEWISAHEFREWVARRMDGSDGEAPWERVTAGNNLSYVKAYWHWCLNRNLTTAPNLAMHQHILPRANKTKAQTKFGKKANHRYSCEDRWKPYHAERDTEDTLADMVLLGMYTGCRIDELVRMKLDKVGDDWLRVADSKTESGLRHIPIHKVIQQLVERLKQISKDGYLISGLSDDNQFKNSIRGIS